ncbi:MAG: type II and III secretion system protein family protein [Beijerinckiaceae bacterium]
MLTSKNQFLAGAALLIGLSLLASWPAQAQGKRKDDAQSVNRVPSPRLQTGAADTSTARSIDMGIGRSIIVDLPRDAKEVFVGNPAIANAVVRSARKLFVIGVAAGSTTIIALDAEGNQIAALEMQVGREPGLLQKTMKAAIPYADIRIANIGDSIVLTGTVDTVLEAQKAVDIARGFIGSAGPAAGVGAAGGAADNKVINSLSIRGKDQVMVKVTIAEVRRSAIKQLGVNLTGNWEVAGKNFGGSTNNNFSASLLQPPNIVSAGVQAGTALAKQVDVRLLERHGVLRTLAEPTLTAISGETAKFVAGGEIPVPKSEETVQGVGGGIFSQPTTRLTLEYRPYGVMLNFTPVVLSEGRISLSIGTEVTEVDVENPLPLTRANAPAFRTRKAFTTIELPSGGSLVTAGLIQQVSRQALNGLPGLINVPVLGALFRSRDYFREETELMIIVTPFIAKPSAATALSKPDDGYVESSDPSAILMGRLNRVYGAAGAATPPTSYRGKVGFIHE